MLVLVRPTCAWATGARVANVERNGQRAGIVRKAGALSLETITPDIPDMQRCLPSRRQHAGTLLCWKHRASGANRLAIKMTSSELAMSRFNT